MKIRHLAWLGLAAAFLLPSQAAPLARTQVEQGNLADIAYVFQTLDQTPERPFTAKAVR